MQQRKLLFACLLGGLGLSRASLGAVGPEPLVGQFETYTVKKGDTLLRIARRNNMTLSQITLANHLSPGKHLHPGQKLTLPALYILPRNPTEGIVLNVPERQVYLFQGGQMKAHYPVAVGKSDWQTATGTFKLVEKKVNPTWQPTKEMVERTTIKDDPVPPGKENPLGDRWMGWSKPGFGFHSTNAPSSVGTVVSHGCVRLYPEAAHAMFDRVKVGMPIYAMYEPVKIGERGGKFYLSVYPDIYHEGLTSLAHVQKIFAEEGLSPLVNPTDLKRIVRDQAGVPQRIIGADQVITVNGQAVPLPLAPVNVAGTWVVAAKEVVVKMGGELVPDGKQAVKITAKGHTLVLHEGTKTAQLDDKPIPLAVAPLRVKGILLVPLAPLTQVCNAELAHLKGKPLALTVRQ